MSKLPKAPLVEVVTELRWKITSKEELAGVQYLYGDLYNELKQKYPFRESILPVEVPIEMTLNQPVHRFRSEKGGYPLLQVGPGIITLNTIDAKYYWETFFEDAKELIQTFFTIYSPNNTMAPALLYIDFFPFDFHENNVHEFINRKFNVTFGQSFLETEKLPTDFNMGFAYNMDLGDLRVNFQKGKNKGTEGILLQTRLNGNPDQPNIEIINNWLKEAHSLLSNLFKQLTQGELYESFK
ncbi:TIGR04255 family protein [Anaerophaga thermohalophila]|uniref:TIGR04255 family protein n=1 Tax=Anaerophaga thermohalophila TaxID=177400 RepID=UPI000237D410|nr:TIGR04255 family protein [Anaerophaga thermohalophila]